MPNRTRLSLILATGLAAGVLALLLAGVPAAGAGGLNRLYLPAVVLEATDTPQPAPTATATLVPVATSTPTNTQQPDSCDHSYPTICVPPPPPDLDCGDIPYRNFQVVPPDDHHFDSNHDGIGCESGQASQ